MKILIFTLLLASNLTYSFISGVYTPKSADLCPEFFSKDEFPIPSAFTDSRISIELRPASSEFLCDKDDIYSVLEVYGSDVKRIALFKKSCKRFYKDQNKHALFEVSDSKITFTNKGSEFSLCESEFGIRLPCIKRWNQLWSFEKAQNDLLYKWSYLDVDKVQRSGFCLLTNLIED